MKNVRKILDWRRPWSWLLAAVLLYALGGFLLAPWLLERQLVRTLSERLGLDTSVGRIALNPFSFTLLIEELQIAQPGGEPLLELQQGFVDFELASLWRRVYSFDEIRFEGLGLSLQRFADGGDSLSQLAARWQATARADDKPAAETASVAIREVLFEDGLFRLLDRTTRDPAELVIADFDLKLSQVSSDARARIGVEMAMEMATGGTLQFSGGLVALPEFAADGELLVAALALAPGQPYLAEHAAVVLENGMLDIAGTVAATADSGPSFKGRMAIRELQLFDSRGRESLAAWESVALEGLELLLDSSSMSVAEIEVQAPYLRLAIAADGSNNIGRALERGDADDQAAERDDGGAANGAEPFRLEVGRVRIVDGASTFSDLSLPLPFLAEIRELGGSISTISTASDEPARIELEGQVGEYGELRAEGEFRPLAYKELTRLDLTFTNVGLPPWSPYLIRFAGRALADGKVDLELHYELQDRRLRGDNAIVIRDLELGEYVEHPGASKLPLGLAVALLKDANGVIDVDLPVRGDLDNPEFSYGRIIMRALVRLIRDVATSPFRLLARLAGGSESEFDSIGFRPGRAELAPPEREKIARLADALEQRPQLRLEVTPVLDPVADRQAISERELDAVLDKDAADPQDRRAVLEELYSEHELSPDLDSLAGQFHAAESENGSGLDEAAYLGALRQRLIDAWRVPEEALQGLATSRADNVAAELESHNPALSERVERNAQAQLGKASNDSIAMALKVAPLEGG